MFFDQKGRNIDEASLIADLAPLPKSYSGTIKVVNETESITGISKRPGSSVRSPPNEDRQSVFPGIATAHRGRGEGK